MYNQLHLLHSSGWTAYERMTGHISTGYETKSSGLGGGAIRSVSMYLRGLLCVLVLYTLCGALELQSVKLQRSLDDAAVRDSTLESAI